VITTYLTQTPRVPDLLKQINFLNLLTPAQPPIQIKNIFQTDPALSFSLPYQLICTETVLENPNENFISFFSDRWRQTEKIFFNSISEAAELLTQKNNIIYFHLPFNSIRRGKLIEDDLFKRYPSALKKFSYNYHPLAFPIQRYPKFGCFTLLDSQHLLCSSHTQSSIPFGIYHFEEDKTTPPNRAYLKLWEALCEFKTYPKPGDICLDLGASPGGWTWVLQSLGSKVYAIDKAPLAPHIQKLNNIHYQQDSAFGLNLKKFKKIDWLVCDIICYPDKLFSQFMHWTAPDSPVQKIICTIKLQGDLTDDKLKEIHQFYHSHSVFIKQLWHNKHELTLFWKK